jgi:glycosyltransferase involved in cell wall biosynthesis
MISVVIPVYNHERYLADAIHSCLLCNEVTEILIADDGSNDRSREIIRFFAMRFPNKIRDLTDEPAVNIGAHSRINSLCAEASNTWIAILNSDDRFEPGRFRNFKEFARYTRADLVFGNCAIVGPENELLGYKYGLYTPEYPVPNEIDVAAVFRENLWLLALLNQNFVATTSNIVFKKSLFERLEGFGAYRYIHDWDFLIRAAAVYNVAYNPNMWMDYRIHPSNTISENAFKVKAEVKAMMSDLLARSEISNQLGKRYSADVVAASLNGNRYLEEKSAITFVFSDPYHSNAVRLAQHFPNCRIVQTLPEAMGQSQYVYAPKSLDQVLSYNDLLNLLIASAAGNLDFCICNIAGGDGHNFVGDVSNVSIWRPAVLSDLAAGQSLSGLRGRLISIPRSTAVASSAIETAFLAGNVSISDRSIVVDGFRADTVPPFHLSDLSAKDLLDASDQRTVVFVFPAVLAVGGAENLLIELMRNLKQSFRFIVICTERLTADQGSSVERALEHADGYFDLTQLGSQADFLSILAWMKAAYAPKIVFFTNGSIWQVQHSWQMRKLFRDTAIVDHQVYDSKFGWVEWLRYPNLRGSERFIAVTKKIEEHFLNTLKLDRGKIDFIPHPINSERISLNLPRFDPDTSLKKFGLASDRVIVAFVGRMVSQKRPWLYLDIAERAKRDGLQVQFVMAGQGDLSDSVEDRIRNSDLDNVVRLSNVSPLEELYVTTDLLVITSEYEGVPLAMLEAMSAGVPVFSTDVGDIGLVLKKYHDQTVQPVEAEADELYAEFRCAVSNIQALKEVARKAASSVLHDYSGAHIAKMYEASFEHALTRYASVRAF